MDHEPLHKEFIAYLGALFAYISFRLRHAGFNFEKIKDLIVDVLLARRGAHTSLFLHASILTLAALTVAGGIFSRTAVVSGSYPGVAVNPLVAGASDIAGGGVISAEITPVTIISEKPRDKVEEYEVREGDAVSGIAQEFGVSEATILWENDLSSTSQIRQGQKLKILPVSGVQVKVASGDTIYSLAKKHKASAQAIVDFPFNDIGDDFGLKTDQLLIIPDGAPPQKPKPVPTQYLAKENILVTDLGTAQFIWSATGGITQYFTWYHPGIDIANLAGGPILAADSGTVVLAGWPDAQGYGNRVILDHGNGFKTLYAHMSSVYVSPGQRVSKGEVIGAMGSTGRSTGTHLHLEISKDGVNLNPLGLLGK